MNITWDAQEYSDVFPFVYHYGEDVLKLLDITPGIQSLIWTVETSH